MRNIEEFVAKEEVFSDRSLFASSDEECGQTQQKIQPTIVKKQERSGHSLLMGKKETSKRHRENRRKIAVKSEKNRSDVENEANEVAGEGSSKKRGNESLVGSGNHSGKQKKTNQVVPPGW